MAKYSIEEATLTGIANAIRDKEGTTAAIPVPDMAARIAAIETGGGGITPTGELAITENGTYDVTEYASAAVNVSGGVEPPAVGFVPTAWNVDGGFLGGIWYGTEIPDTFWGMNSAPKVINNLTNITLPSNLQKIGSWVFNSCKSLTLTSLPSGVTSIGERAFSGCSKLALTSLPNGITSIAASAFSGCSELALTSLPEGVTSIAASAFSGCSKLTIATIPAGVTTIGNYAFQSCYGLTSITFKGTPTTIGHANYPAFKSCDNLLTINVPWAEGEVANAPWGATNATINYNYTGE